MAIFLSLEEHMGPCMKKKHTRIKCYMTQPVLEEFYDLNHQGKVFFFSSLSTGFFFFKKSGKRWRVLQIYK